MGHEEKHNNKNKIKWIMRSMNIFRRNFNLMSLDFELCFVVRKIEILNAELEHHNNIQCHNSAVRWRNVDGNTDIEICILYSEAMRESQ